MIARDPALFSVKGRECDRIGDILVVKNDRRGSERLLSGVRVDSGRKEEIENERKDARGGSAAPRAMPIICGGA